MSFIRPAMLIATAILFSACNHTVNPPPGSNPPGSNPPPSGPTPPGYSTVGFTATETNSFVVDAVLEMGSGITKNYRSKTPLDFKAVYDPQSGMMSVYAYGQAFDGTYDAETKTFYGSSKLFGNVSPNFVRVATTTWAYRIDGQIDQNDGKFRHDFAAAGGITFDPPMSGGGHYDGTFGGTLESFNSISSNSIPVVADVDADVDFQNKRINVTMKLVPSKSNGASGTINSTSNILKTDGSFLNFADASVYDNGRWHNLSGLLDGAMAGPNSKTLFGTANLGSSSGAAMTAFLTGSFLAADLTP